jgi:hypothetical protein
MTELVVEGELNIGKDNAFDSFLHIDKNNYLIKGVQVTPLCNEAVRIVKMSAELSCRTEKRMSRRKIGCHHSMRLPQYY